MRDLQVVDARLEIAKRVRAAAVGRGLALEARVPVGDRDRRAGEDRPGRVFDAAHQHAVEHLRLRRWVTATRRPPGSTIASKRPALSFSSYSVLFAGTAHRTGPFRKGFFAELENQGRCAVRAFSRGGGRIQNYYSRPRSTLLSSLRPDGCTTLMYGRKYRRASTGHDDCDGRLPRRRRRGVFLHRCRRDPPA